MTRSSSSLTVWLACAAAALFMCGCSPKNPATLLEQANYLRDPDSMDVYEPGYSLKPKMGRIEADWVVNSDQDVSISPCYLRQSSVEREEVTLRYAGLHGDSVCFRTVREVSARSTGEAEGKQEVEESFKDLMLRVVPLNSLEELTPETPWPDHAVTDMLSAKVVDTGSKSFKTGDFNHAGEQEGVTMHRYTVEVCAKTPAFTPESKYLAAVTFPNGTGSTENSAQTYTLGIVRQNNVPSLYLWELPAAAASK